MFELKKINKRLVIVSEQSFIYSPPDFVAKHIKDRAQLQEVVDTFNSTGRYDIDAIVAFETNLRPCRK